MAKFNDDLEQVEEDARKNAERGIFNERQSAKLMIWQLIRKLLHQRKNKNKNNVLGELNGSFALKRLCGLYDD